MDRTSEFNTILARSRGGASHKDSIKQGQVSGQIQAQTELNALAKEISDAVATASLRVSELRKLAKSTALFDDKTARVQALSFHVNEDIRSLNQKIANLEEQMAAQTRHLNKTHCVNMVQILKMRLGEVVREAKMALEDRTNALQQQDERRHRISSGRFALAGARPFGKQGNGLQVQTQDWECDGCQLQADGSRMHATKKLQSSIAELAAMFTQTASLVQEQQEKLGRIDADMDVAQTNVEDAQNELLDYWRRMSSNNKLIVKVFAILIFFVVFFVFCLRD